jgi:hypothetical protein
MLKGKVFFSLCGYGGLWGTTQYVEQLQPILFAMSDRSCYDISKRLARAWAAGKDLNK